MLRWFRRSQIRSEKGLRELIAEVEDKGVITEDEEELLTAVFELDRTLAEDIMVPRTEMQCISIDTKIDAIISHFREKRHTKIPVFEDSLDNIIGMIYTTDVLRLWGENPDWYAGDIMRLPYFIPYTKNILSTLREFQKNYISIAIVMDEFGGVAGLLTTEDIIEEIVGELQDELDKDKSAYKILDDGSVIVPGIFELDQLEDILDVKYDTKDIRTIGGLLMDKLDRVPQEGEEKKISGTLITVLKASRQRISRVKVKKV
ncbi:HlyC/CorC family transporter [candidate division WOR-3 bacterium]|nr:HlyC/CorC family transporter [candidate division WOR-3 bacterium]MCK4525728.1 HlyC/CorC family transporter [candidate division WOR-3 bacterium]